LKRQIKRETLSAYIAPTVTLIGSNPVLDTSVLLRGFLDDRGSVSSIIVYFQWGKTTDYDSETSHQTLTSNDTLFVAWITPLKKSTTYHFRAVAVGDGVSYSEDETFQTMPYPQ
jgi:hypothetical protein